MNNLSWLIYFADVLPAFASTVSVLSVLSLGLFCIVAFVSAAACEWESVAPYMKWIFVPVTALFLITPIPSKETIYLIAASEVGEAALDTPEVTKIRAIINKFLDEAAAPEKE